MAPTSADMWPANLPTARILGIFGRSLALRAHRTRNPPRRQDRAVTLSQHRLAAIASESRPRPRVDPAAHRAPSRTEWIHANLFSDYDGQKR